MKNNFIASDNEV
jgi:hypothetical protein